LRDQACLLRAQAPVVLLLVAVLRHPPLLLQDPRALAFQRLPALDALPVVGDAATLLFDPALLLVLRDTPGLRRLAVGHAPLLGDALRGQRLFAGVFLTRTLAAFVLRLLAFDACVTFVPGALLGVALRGQALLLVLARGTFAAVATAFGAALGGLVLPLCRGLATLDNLAGHGVRPTFDNTPLDRTTFNRTALRRLPAGTCLRPLYGGAGLVRLRLLGLLLVGLLVGCTLVLLRLLTVILGRLSGHCRRGEGDRQHAADHGGQGVTGKGGSHCGASCDEQPGVLDMHYT